MASAVRDSNSFFIRHSILAYFLLTYAISWMGAAAVALPGIIRGNGVSKITGIVMFPAMLLGPCLAGILMTRLVDTNGGVKDLFRRMCTLSAGGWYAVLLIPPLLVLTTLWLVSRFLSPAFAPNHFYFGMLFGIPAGLLEEIGWTGYAFPKMQSRYGFSRAAILLGMLWGAWHLPVIGYLGAAAPHNGHRLQFFLAFAFAMSAMRILIAWLYVNTSSVLLAQLMHVTSTGALVIFSPPVSAAQESLWYALYGCALWTVIAIPAGSGQFTRYRRNRDLCPVVLLDH